MRGCSPCMVGILEALGGFEGMAAGEDVVAVAVVVADIAVANIHFH